MNKKVLTLCASFLLAGGMLSSLSAEKISAVADDGKYYKIQRVQYHGSGWVDDESVRYLDQNGDISGIAEEAVADDYWTVITVEGGYQLKNLEGKTLTVGETTVFGEESSVATYSQLTIGENDWVANQASAMEGTTGFYRLVPQSSITMGTTGWGCAFDALGTTLETVSGNYTLENGKTYRFNTIVDGTYYTSAIFKATQDASNETWSFTYNATGATLVIDGENDFKAVTTDGGVYFEIPSRGKFISWDVNAGEFKLVEVLEDATLFAFRETSAETSYLLTAKELNWYEKDGFSVTIKYQDEDDNFTKTDIAGNPFVGHLTPMIYLAGKMQPATGGQTSFFLKNEEGKYIVAKANMVGQQIQSYKFETITETELLRDLSVNTIEKTYFGVFAANALQNEYEKDVQALSQLANLYVIVGGEYLRVGNLVENDVPTLKAATDYNWTGLGLKPVKIELGGGTLVDAKDLLVKDKFYTVELLKGVGTQYGFLTANGTLYSTFATSAGNELEQQWALTYENGDFIFTNRENTDITYTFDGDKLYSTDEDDTYRFDSNTYVIKTIDGTEETDGYETLADVKNNKFYIGYFSNVYEESWFTENHEGTNNHTIGLDTDIESALEWTATEYAAERTAEENPDFTWKYTPTDSIYVVSTLGYYDGNTYKTTKDSLKIVSYSFVNQYGEPLVWDGNKYVANPNKEAKAQKFALRKDADQLNLRPVALEAKTVNALKGQEEALADQMYNSFNNKEDLQKMYAGDAQNGRLVNHELYKGNDWDLFVVEPTEKPMYRRVVSPLDTVSIFRDGNNQSVLFESKGFLGMENLSQFPDIAPGMIADTAYIGNGDITYYRPQYLLAVDAIQHGPTTWCPDHGYGATCQHAIDIKGYLEGRFLVNLKDTAIAWDEANKHKDGNPYINSENYYKLGFVQATHRNDSLIIAEDNNRIYVGDENYNVAKFAFRYVDTEAQSFVIETADYNRLNETNPGAQKPTYGYLKWMNNVVVVVPEIENADVYNMNEAFEGQPTANEEISANAAVSVVATNGAVIVKGAEGKNVVVSTILGKVVANEVLNSDNETIAAPAGIVVVSVDGESFKVAVK